MARSNASKLRRRLEREGHLNPDIHRGSWRGLVPVERTTPTKREALSRQENKHKKEWNRLPQGGSDGSISFCPGDSSGRLPSMRSGGTLLPCHGIHPWPACLIVRA
ncbi:hypothetical protein PM3016_1815 [Paenibacillus mucilaginosus 3016]|uniref:Uncharacterized protein n=1 Tax=Paenibacillus mucilaginosus 3016 TaxID=1116391 RepID=H6NH47_9BACL|nr:hypothetical protein [Paenibacillus mucilaginosus]AFC28725.1 hypothetical protein PM3016_1815 [Paenibacillus mucilaginosus 3016]